MENFASNSGPVQTAMQQAPGTMKTNMQQKASSHMTEEEKNMVAAKKQDLKNKVTTEHFFPLPSVNESEFKLKNNSNKQMTQKMINNNKIDSCMNLYTPKFEAVGNVCSPTATFQNELNAQGLNSPEGFDSMVVGSPLQ